MTSDKDVRAASAPVECWHCEADFTKPKSVTVFMYGEEVLGRVDPARQRILLAGDYLDEAFSTDEITCMNCFKITKVVDIFDQERTDVEGEGVPLQAIERGEPCTAGLTENEQDLPVSLDGGCPHCGRKRSRDDDTPGPVQTCDMCGTSYQETRTR